MDKKLSYAWTSGGYGILTGNVYVVGTIGNTTKLLKYNSSGILIWSRIDSIQTSGMGICAAADKYGNVYYTAEDLLFRIATIRYDSSGNRNWARYYSNAGADARANAMAVDYAGNIYIAGYGRITASYNYLTIKYNPQGDTLWTAVYYNNYGGSSANAICIDLQYNVYITGESINSMTNDDYVTIKYNNNGIQQWVKIYDNNHLGDGANDIIVDKYGYSYVTGSVEYAHNHRVIGTIKYTPDGDSVWTRIYIPPLSLPFEYGNNLLLDSSLNVYVTGRGSDTLGGSLRTIKYDKNGNLLWTTSDTGANIPSSSILDKYSNIYSTSATGAIPSKFYSTQYSSSGYKIWSSYYPNNIPQYGNYSGIRLFLDNNNNLYLFGGSYDSSILIKYSLITNIKKTSEIINTSYKLYQNYPNPFNPETLIRFNISMDSRLRGNDKVVLKVYDILGKEIQTLVNESLQPGSYEVTFDARQPGLGSQLPSGVYFYKLTTEGFSETKKMVLMK